MEQQLTVLHVDDDPSFLELAARLYEREAGDVEVATATTPEEAFELLGGSGDGDGDGDADAGGIDCVVSDSLRTASGESFVDELRRRHPTVPIVLCTGAAWEEVAGAAQADVSAYVQKGSADALTALASRVRELTGEGDADAAVDVAAVADAGDTASPERLERPADGAPGAEPPVGAEDAPLGDDWEVLARHDWSSDSELVVTIVDVVDSVVGSDDGREPLYGTINGEVLEELLRPRFGRGERAGDVVIQFHFRGTDVAVTGEGYVAVKNVDSADGGAPYRDARTNDDGADPVGDGDAGADGDLRTIGDVGRVASRDDRSQDDPPSSSSSEETR